MDKIGGAFKNLARSYIENRIAKIGWWNAIWCRQFQGAISLSYWEVIWNDKNGSRFKIINR